MTEAECAAASGTFYGCDVPCADVECGGGTPICCTNGGRCAFEFPLTGTLHWTLSGTMTYRLSNTTCPLGTNTYSFDTTDNYVLTSPVGIPATACSVPLPSHNEGLFGATGGSIPAECASLVLVKQVLLNPSQQIAAGTFRQLWAVACLELFPTGTSSHRFTLYVGISNAANTAVSLNAQYVALVNITECGTFSTGSQVLQSGLAFCDVNYRQFDFTASATFTLSPSTTCTPSLDSLP